MPKPNDFAPETPDAPSAPARRAGRAKEPIGTTLGKVAERALEADPRDVDAHVPSELDIRVAEAMLLGNVKIKAIARESKIGEGSVRETLLDPVRCAWICRTVERSVRSRIGLVVASMLERAVNGDVRAADLLLKHFGDSWKKNVNLNISGTMDFSRLSDTDLETLVRAAQKEDRLLIESESKPSDQVPASPRDPQGA